MAVSTEIRASLVTAIAPITWGSTYYVTAHFLPPDHALWGGVIRALPAGLLMVAWRRRLLTGAWWWRTAAIGVLTVGAFFWLIYIAAVRLPGGVAATLMATSPIVLMLFAWPVVGERPRAVALAGGVLGALGVTLLVTRGNGGIDRLGVLASLTAMVLAQIGFVLTKRWAAPVDGVTLAGWQLVAGGLFLLPFAVLAEGSPPHLTGDNLLGFLYVAGIATAAAYVAWLTGLRTLPAGTVGLIGLLNPVSGLAIGVVLAGERFGVLQAVGVALVLVGVLAGQSAVLARIRGQQARPVDSGGG